MPKWLHLITAITPADIVRVSACAEGAQPWHVRTARKPAEWGTDLPLYAADAIVQCTATFTGYRRDIRLLGIVVRTVDQLDVSITCKEPRTADCYLLSKHLAHRLSSRKHTPLTVLFCLNLSTAHLAIDNRQLATWQTLQRHANSRHSGTMQLMLCEGAAGAKHR